MTKEEQKGMKTVYIYTMTNAKSPKTLSARGIFTLATETARGVADLTSQIEMENVSANQAELQILIAALHRLTELCNLIIYTDSQYIKSALESWLPEWREHDWCKTDGKEVKHAKEWKELDQLIQGSSVSVELNQWYTYRKWMETELSRRK